MRRVSATSTDCLLGFGAGVMLAATAFSLLIPALDVAGEQGHSAWTAALLVSVGLLAGGGGLLAVDRVLLRHLGPGSAAAQRSAALSPVLLFVIAIVAHNVPEGMAVGVAAAGDQPTGLALGIALQDIPEGLVVAMMLAAAGMARGKAFLCGAASGVVEPLAAVIAAWLTGLSHSLLPWGLALAAGAMLVAVVHEIVPELHRNDHSTAATLALCAGFAVMLILDTALV
jgi:zinc transporter, ZIP family